MWLLHYISNFQSRINDVKLSSDECHKTWLVFIIWSQWTLLIKSYFCRVNTHEYSQNKSRNILHVSYRSRNTYTHKWHIKSFVVAGRFCNIIPLHRNVLSGTWARLPAVPHDYMQALNRLLDVKTLNRALNFISNLVFWNTKHIIKDGLNEKLNTVTFVQGRYIHV